MSNNHTVVSLKEMADCLLWVEVRERTAGGGCSSQVGARQNFSSRIRGNNLSRCPELCVEVRHAWSTDWVDRELDCWAERHKQQTFRREG